jgi:hypothetical protein
VDSIGISDMDPCERARRERLDVVESFEDESLHDEPLMEG